MGDGQNRTLLIIDDDFVNREILKNIFSPYYTIDEAENGVEGLEKIISDNGKYSAVFLDVMMPKMSGLQVLRELNEHHFGYTKNVPIFLITAHTDGDIVEEAYSLGVMDVIGKPVLSYMVLRRAQSVVELFSARRELSSIVREQDNELLRRAQVINELNKGMLEALATAIEFRNGESGEHVRRIHDITDYILRNTKVGEGLGDEVIEQIAVASVLHDIGKIAIPDNILNKPGRLTPEEFEVMKTHSSNGSELLESIPQLQSNGVYPYAQDIARHHHERWDGRGYPDGLKGDEISIWAQVVSLADVYDALTSKRCYKDAFPAERAVEMIKNGECGVFNPKLLDCFFEVEPTLRKLYNKA